MEKDFDKLISRINELARKKRAEGLTEGETREQLALRKEYIRIFRANMRSQLDRVIIKEPDGSLTPLKRKKENQDE